MAGSRIDDVSSIESAVKLGRRQQTFRVAGRLIVGEEQSLECSQSQVSGKDRYTLEMILLKGNRSPC